MPIMLVQRRAEASHRWPVVQILCFKDFYCFGFFCFTSILSQVFCSIKKIIYSCSFHCFHQGDLVPSWRRGVSGVSVWMHTDPHPVVQMLPWWLGRLEGKASVWLIVYCPGFHICHTTKGILAFCGKLNPMPTALTNICFTIVIECGIKTALWIQLVL